MISIGKAKERIIQYLNFFDQDYEIVIEENMTVLERHVCIFYYNTRAFLEDKNISAALAGNNPILYDLSTNEVYYVTPGTQPRELINNYLDGKLTLQRIDTSYIDGNV